MDHLKTISIQCWRDSIPVAQQIELTNAIEQGHVLFFPRLAFQLSAEELSILSPNFVNPKSKNISFDLSTQEIRGITSSASKKKPLFYALLNRYATQARHFINQLFPDYTQALIVGRTSLRPVEIIGRHSSYRKDDKRLHVDAFPANPNQGLRILRVFSNINPEGKPRIWRLGESFEEVVKQFLPLLQKPIPGSAALFHFFKITKRYRTLYDHYMLQLHDHMKKDERYQKNANQQEVHFPAETTWVVQTDHVSHAAMSGQHLLEQTFYLPIHAMRDESKSPLRILEKFFQKKLI